MGRLSVCFRWVLFAGINVRVGRMTHSLYIEHIIEEPIKAGEDYVVAAYPREDPVCGLIVSTSARRDIEIKYCIASRRKLRLGGGKVGRE